MMSLHVNHDDYTCLRTSTLVVLSLEPGKTRQWEFFNCETVYSNFSIYHRTLLVYSGVFTFLVDAYPSYAASALAVNSFARSTFGGIFPLFGIQSMFFCLSAYGILELEESH